LMPAPPPRLRSLRLLRHLCLRGRRGLDGRLSLGERVAQFLLAQRRIACEALCPPRCPERAFARRQALTALLVAIAEPVPLRCAQSPDDHWIARTGTRAGFLLQARDQRLIAPVELRVGPREIAHEASALIVGRG